jgi:hypothetical protein
MVHHKKNLQNHFHSSRYRLFFVLDVCAVSFGDERRSMTVSENIQYPIGKFKKPGHIVHAILR